MLKPPITREHLSHTATRSAPRKARECARLLTRSSSLELEEQSQSAGCVGDVSTATCVMTDLYLKMKDHPMCPTLMPYGLISVYRSTMASLASMTRLDGPAIRRAFTRTPADHATR
jgi:hypothetical protein